MLDFMIYEDGIYRIPTEEEKKHIEIERNNPPEYIDYIIDMQNQIDILTLDRAKERGLI